MKFKNDTIHHYMGYTMVWTLDKINVGQGATNGSSLTTLGLGYLWDNLFLWDNEPRTVQPRVR